MQGDIKVGDWGGGVREVTAVCQQSACATELHVTASNICLCWLTSLQVSVAVSCVYLRCHAMMCHEGDFSGASHRCQFHKRLTSHVGCRNRKWLIFLVPSLVLGAFLLTINSSWCCAHHFGQFSSFPVVWNISTSSRRPDEVVNVIFVKVHKAASSTMFNIFIRLSVSRGLYVMFPAEGNIHNETTQEVRGIVPHPQSPPFVFNILCHHIVFNASQLRHVFPVDVRYVTMLRQPWGQVVSAFQYYREVYPKPYLTNIQSFEDYVSDVLSFEPIDPRQSFTNNRQSIDLGLPPGQLWNMSHVPVFVRHVQDTFHLVLLVEHFSESLVLLKRRLRWSMKDVVFMVSNRQTSKISVKIERHLQARLLQLNHYDVALYEHFYAIFWQHVQAEGPLFQDEVRAFDDIQSKVRQFCSGSTHSRESLMVEATPWSETFTISGAECQVLRMTELELNDRARHQQVSRMTKEYPVQAFSG